VVFQDRLWLLGGWFNSFAEPPRDVWSSADGKTWNLITREAPWKHSDLPMTVVFRDKIWLLGGWYNGRLPGHSACAEVWSSASGSDWMLETPRAGWSPRLAAGAVVFQDKLWILGGTENYYFGDERSLKNDVWCSCDGKEWTQVTAHAGWSPRVPGSRRRELRPTHAVFRTPHVIQRVIFRCIVAHAQPLSNEVWSSLS
jgi:hypothetical protein